MKIKEKIINLFKIIKKSFEKFPITIIAVAFLSVLYAINLNNDFISSKMLVNITNFIVVFSCANFLIETVFENKKIKSKLKMEIICYLMSAIWALMLTLAINLETDFLGMTNEIFMFRIARLFYCYLLVTIVLGIYFNYKKSNETLSKYLASTFVNIFKTTLIYGIFAAGIAAIVAIFIYLILNGSSYTLISRPEILLLGLYYFPTLLYTLCTKEELGKFSKIVLKYVLGSLVMATFVVVYIYIIKIILLRSIPSNQIFRILATLFIVGMPIWTMAKAFDENSIFDKINRKMPILFIPFILLQIYSIAVRIGENGITPMRYWCIMLIIFEIIYTCFYIKKEEKVGDALFIGTTVFAIIGIIVPFVNMFYISDRSQYNRFKVYNEKSEYTDEEKISIYSSYYYLKYKSEEGEKYLELTESEEKEIKGFKQSTNLSSESTSSENYTYLYATNDIYNIDISGYNRLCKISALSNDIEDFSANINNFKINFKLYDENGNELEEKIEVDLTAKVKEYIENNIYISNYFAENNEMQIDENNKIILTQVRINYYEESNEIGYYSINGYLLTND